LKRLVLSGLLRSLCALAMASVGEQSSPCRSATPLSLSGEGRFGEKPKQGEVKRHFIQHDKRCLVPQRLTRPTTVIPSDSEESISETACLVWILHGAALLCNDGCRGITHLVCQSTSVLSHVVKHGLHVVVLFESLQERVHVVFLLLREFNGA